ncbi:Cytochrome P450 [Neofusicoccum parvum]|nr:Cytochrome P450 [Neofusicoccum parvum]
MSTTHREAFSLPPAPLIFGALASSLILALFATAVYNIYFHPLSKYPGPKYAAATGLASWYIFSSGNGPFWVRRMHEQYGEIVRLGPDQLSFINPQAWKDIYGHRIGSASKKAVRKDWRKYPADVNGHINMVTALDDTEHARFRKVFTNAFSDKALRQQESLIKSYADHLIRNLGKVTGETNIILHYNCTTFDIMGDLAFGESLGLLDQSDLSPWVRAIFENIKVLELLSIGREYPILGTLTRIILPKPLLDQGKYHFQHSVERVDRRMEHGITEKPDIWNLVLQKGQDVLTRETMYTHASAFMVAGTETTATVLSALTYFLLKNPEKLRKVTDEVRSLESEDDLNLEKLQHLKYLSACFEEALRCYPPVPVGLAREVVSGGTAICGEWIPDKTRVSVPQLATYFSPLNFNDPESFIPERWLPDSQFENDRKDAFQPFSTGPRNCIGKNLAYHEMRLIFSKLLWNFDMELSPKSENWLDQKIWTLWDKNPLYITLKPVHRV